MKTVLFCGNPYAFGILEPLGAALRERGHETLWYVPPLFASRFPFGDRAVWTTELPRVKAYRPDALFVPGNEVPHYLRGVKVQVFHGLAGEKKGHFRIRQYFDLYLTQGPYFTKGFEALGRREQDVEVVETGWCKLDPLFADEARYAAARADLLARHGATRIVLYAPTFSPRLTSAPEALGAIEAVASLPGVLVLIKFHDLMDPQVVARYAALGRERSNIVLVEDRNILPSLRVADLMISDTSSVVYEFILLDRPVVTIRSTSPNVTWTDLPDTSQLADEVRLELDTDRGALRRRETIAHYHPYVDGRSSVRMVEAVERHIERRGVPESRDIPFYRKWKIHSMFGRAPGR